MASNLLQSVPTLKETKIFKRPECFKQMKAAGSKENGSRLPNEYSIPNASKKLTSPLKHRNMSPMSHIRREHIRRLSPLRRENRRRVSPLSRQNQRRLSPLRRENRRRLSPLRRENRRRLSPLSRENRKISPMRRDHRKSPIRRGYKDFYPRRRNCGEENPSRLSRSDTYVKEVVDNKKRRRSEANTVNEEGQMRKRKKTSTDATPRKVVGVLDEIEEFDQLYNEIEEQMWETRNMIVDPTRRRARLYDDIDPDTKDPRMMKEIDKRSVYYAIHMHIQKFQTHRPVMYLNKCHYSK